MLINVEASDAPFAVEGTRADRPSGERTTNRNGRLPDRLTLEIEAKSEKIQTSEGLSNAGPQAAIKTAVNLSPGNSLFWALHRRMTLNRYSSFSW